MFTWWWCYFGVIQILDPLRTEEDYFFCLYVLVKRLTSSSERCLIRLSCSINAQIMLFLHANLCFVKTNWSKKHDIDSMK